jgi:hypothetical protein
VDQHLERIDQLDLINQEMRALYRNEKDTSKQVLILEKIAQLQITFISDAILNGRYSSTHK